MELNISIRPDTTAQVVNITVSLVQDGKVKRFHRKLPWAEWEAAKPALKALFADVL